MFPLKLIFFIFRGPRDAPIDDLFIYIFYTNGRRVNEDLPPLGFLLQSKFITRISQSQKVNENLIFFVLIIIDKKALHCITLHFVLYLLCHGAKLLNGFYE